MLVSGCAFSILGLKVKKEDLLRAIRRAYFQLLGALGRSLIGTLVAYGEHYLGIYGVHKDCIWGI